MQAFPPTPRIEDAPAALLDGGHLWLQEWVDGAGLRFRAADSGLLTFGDRERTFGADDVPAPLGSAVRHVRERFDRDAFRAAVDDVEAHVFFGRATLRRRIDYDWERTPPFLGVDVWSAEKGAFLAPDVVERAFSRLGLEPVNALAKEVRAADFHPGAYEVPRSAWYDGPAAGVVVRNKTGLRATLLRPGFEGDEPAPLEATPADLAREYASADRVERIARELEAAGRPVAFDAVYERVLEALHREEHGRLAHDDAAVDEQAVRSAVAELTRRRLSE